MTTTAFETAFAQTHENEGGWKLNTIPNDAGGSTYAGIARRYHSKWEGWRLIDDGINLQSPRLHKLVEEFYYKEFWSKINGDALPLRVAIQLYDIAVNIDPLDAAHMLQRAIGTVKVDGNIGPKTVAAARQLESWKLVDRLHAQKLRHTTDRRNTTDAEWQSWGRGVVNRVATMLEKGAI